MLEKIASSGSLKAHGVVALYPAHSEGDDIMVYNEEGSEIIGVLHGIRQQVRYMCT